MKDKLLIITKSKNTYEYIMKSLDNYPHKYIKLKDRIETNLLDLIELAYYANNGIDRYNNQLKMIVMINMIDYFMKISYKNELISKKKYEAISKHLLELSIMINSWIKYNEES